MTDQIIARSTLSLRPASQFDGPPPANQRASLRGPVLPGLVLGRRIKARRQRLGFELPGSVPEASSETDLLSMGDGHAVVVGPTGSGKSSGVLIPTLLSYPGSAVVVDVKGELSAATAQHRAQFGPVYVIDPFSIGHAPSAALNPLDMADLVAADEVLDAATELSSLISPEQMSSDAYWDVGARSMISRLAGLLALHLPRCRARSLGAVRRLLRLSGTDLGQLLAYAWMAADDTGEIASLAAAFDLAPQTLSCLLSAAEVHLAPFSGAGPTRSLDHTTIPLPALIAGDPVTIFIVLPPERMHSHGSLLRVWIGLLLHLMFRRRGRPVQDTLVLIDECAQLGRLDILPSLYTFARSSGIRTVTCWQDLDQIWAIYPESAAGLIRNAAAVLQLCVEPREAHDRLTSLLGHPLSGRAATSTVHLPDQRRAIPVTAALHFAAPEFHGLAAPALQQGDVARRISRRRSPEAFDRARAAIPPSEPGIPEARGWHAAMTRELRQYTATKASPESGFRALIGRLLGADMLAPIA